MVVFGSDCVLKDVTVVSNDIKVIKADTLESTMAKLIKTNEKVFLPSEVLRLYTRIKPYTNVSNEEKQAHIDRIKKATKKK